jgi:hypothetical protein
LDRCGSYTSVYVSLPGLPVGVPHVIEDWDPKWSVCFFGYYFIHIDIKCRHASDPFPMIEKTGITFVDRIWLEALLKHYELEYEFVSGYAFEFTHENTVRPVAQELWNLRHELKQQGSPVALIVKRVLNCMWGKTMWKGSPFHDVLIKDDPDEVEKYVDEHPLVFSHRKCGDDQVRVRMIKPVYMPFQRPQFGVMVLSVSRALMHEQIYRAVDKGWPVYYCNTDSLLVQVPHAKVVKIGTDLGAAQPGSGGSTILVTPTRCSRSLAVPLSHSRRPLITSCGICSTCHRTIGRL